MIKSLKTTGFSQTIPENSFPKFIDWQMQSHEANNLQSQSPKFLLHQTVVILKLSGVRQGQYVPMEGDHTTRSSNVRFYFRNIKGIRIGSRDTKIAKSDTYLLKDSPNRFWYWQIRF